MNKRIVNRLSWGLMFMVPLLLFFCMGEISSASADEISSASKVPPEIMEAAQKGLAKLPSVVPNTPDGKLALGEFFEISTMHPDAIMNATKKAGSLIESTGMWQVMVLLDGKPYLMMMMDKQNGKWKTTIWGAKRFAEELFQVRKAWPRKDEFKLSTIRIYQAKADVIQVVDRKGQEVGFVPLTSAANAFGLHQSFNPSNILTGPSLLSASQRAITISRQQQ